jgi:hypothetical protein
MGVNVCVGVGEGGGGRGTFVARASFPTLLRYASDLLPEYTHAQKYLGNAIFNVAVHYNVVGGRQ